MEIFSSSTNGDTYNHIPDTVLIERLKDAEQKIKNTKRLIDSFVDQAKPHNYITGGVVIDAFYQIRKKLTD